MFGASLLGALLANAQTNTVNANGDNTRVNARDLRHSEVTAQDQMNDDRDVETTRMIRKALTADPGLSTYAKNVKIIARDGTVTLKGPVRTTVERNEIEAKAAQVAGPGHVINKLEVTPEK